MLKISFDVKKCPTHLSIKLSDLLCFYVTIFAKQAEKKLKDTIHLKMAVTTMLKVIILPNREIDKFVK